MFVRSQSRRTGTDPSSQSHLIWMCSYAGFAAMTGTYTVRMHLHETS
jgi:hypothetical protein